MCCGGCNGVFAHAFVLCFWGGFACGRDVCELTIPILCSVIERPGISHKQLLCCHCTTTMEPAPIVPTCSSCNCNLCLCGFDFGFFGEPCSEPVSSVRPTIVAAPVPQAMWVLVGIRECGWCAGTVLVMTRSPRPTHISHQIVFKSSVSRLWSS